MNKKLTALFLTLCILLSLGSFAMAVENPITVVKDYEELTEEIGDIRLNDAPEDAKDIEYSWINGEPVIAQICFEYDGYEYVYRASVNSEDGSTGDISGVFEQLDEIATVNMNDDDLAGGSYALRYDEKSGQGVANWVSEVTDCQYSLSVDGGCKGKIKKMPIVDVMDEMFLCIQDTETVEATVASVSKKSLAVNLNDGSSAVFDCTEIGRTTVSAGDIVEILYYGDIDGDAYALKLTKIGIAEEEDSQQFSGVIFRLLDKNSMFVLKFFLQMHMGV